MNNYVKLKQKFFTDFNIPLFYTDEQKYDKRNEDSYRIIFITNGNAQILLNTEKQFAISPCLILLNEKDSIEISENTNLEILSLYFQLSLVNADFSLESVRSDDLDFSFTAAQDFFLVEPFIKSSEKAQSIIRLNVGAEERVKSIFQKLKTELDEYNTESWPCSIRCHFYELLLLIAKLSTEKQADAPLVAPVDDDSINRIIVYLHTNFSDKITIKKLANMFDTNRTTLSLKFKEKTGQTIISYLSSLRTKMAATMLHNTDLTVIDIMYRVGFEDKSHFGRFFKREFGISPSEYRKEHSGVS